MKVARVCETHHQTFLIGGKWNTRTVIFVIIRRAPDEDWPSRAKCHLYECWVDDTNHNRQQLFTAARQREEWAQKPETLVSSVEEVQRSGAQRKPRKRPKIAAGCSPSPAVIHPQCGN